ncbi:hydrogenase formation protein HypD [Pseudanabaena sp. ABRG5-3]|uniref:hydrogenase formation protein HypD n=1 Tax=Pseudanabaena sp. ABRG5-3 TaxID=685565 RepID=UPI000DC6F0A7|nr:hydrogenase formation protein HypD [Pseudanabaena sp. ABRG5-3]BBC26283.1 hydrogenase expression/formation protein [Pseudanabaena sp. ABRG5-3]
MKYIDEYRDRQLAHEYASAIASITTRPWTLMEICGGQTHSIVKHGIDRLIPSEITLIHGPGCPVCVTPIALIDQAIAIASQPNVTLCSFGDMLRVPGSSSDLLSAKASGADVRMVYSPLDAVKLAQQDSHRQVIFFAVGFETTAPITALAIAQAAQLGLDNFSILCAHVLVPPAMEAILSNPDHMMQGFLAAGHVCTVMGYGEYEAIAQRYQVPIVVTGFEPIDILQGIYLCIKQLEAGKAEVENQYARSVKKEGNQQAIAMMQEVFEATNRQWRGLAEIPESGLRLKDKYAAFDAQKRFNYEDNALEISESPLCISGLILQGTSKPHQCPSFGKACTPEHPLGAPMVSSEGACVAYYQHAVR